MWVLYFFLVFAICLSEKMSDALLLQGCVFVSDMQPAYIETPRTKAGRKATGHSTSVAHKRYVAWGSHKLAIKNWSKFAPKSLDKHICE
jgi:hypothetical protein